MRRLLSLLVRVATYAAIAGGASGVALWKLLASERLGDGRVGSGGSILALVLLLLPAGWLLNVRFTLASLRDLPDTLVEVAERAQAITAVGAVRSYGDLSGSWALVVQLLSPVFWIASGLALAAVLPMTLVAMVAAAIAS